jgi:hypothetical protein
MAKVTGNQLIVRALKDEGVDTTFYLVSAPTADVARLFFEAGIRPSSDPSCLLTIFLRVLSTALGLLFALSPGVWMAYNLV